MATRLSLAAGTGRRDVNLILVNKLRPGFISQLFSSNNLFQALKSSKTVRKQEGGKTIEQGLHLGSDKNIGTFGRADTKSAEYMDTKSAAETNWRRYYGTVLSLLVDRQEARGEFTILNKMKDDMDTVYESKTEMMEADLYGGLSQGGIRDGKGFDGLRAMIADNPLRNALPIDISGET